MSDLTRKRAVLYRALQQHGSAVIAFSGGVDSSVLLAAAVEAIGPQCVLAVTAQSPTYPKAELQLARAIARQLGARLKVVKTAEFDNPNFVKNPPRRCYYCKSELFAELQKIARAEGLAVVLDGTNYDDRGDFRPGRDAARECGVKSPLLEAKLTKQDLRALARSYGLPNSAKPAAACLASRVPYGVRLGLPLLKRIDRAESLLAGLGFTQIRVRDHGETARIEIDPREFSRIVVPETTRKVLAGLKRLGYRCVTLDLAGYRTGSFNPPAGRKARIPG